MPFITFLPKFSTCAITFDLTRRKFQFAGFSSDSLAERMHDCQCKVLLTADSVWRGEKLIGLKKICDEAMDKCKQLGHEISTCIVVNHLPRLAATQQRNGVKSENGNGLVNGSPSKNKEKVRLN